MISSGDLTVLVAAVGVVLGLFFVVRHYVNRAETLDGSDSRHQGGH
jgi:hypothetical protein